jgi:hypothetical protein
MIREEAMPTGNRMIIELKTKRRWIVSVLEAVAEAQDTRVAARVSVKQGSGRTMNPGQKGFAMRLKAATRPLADASR